MLISEEEVLGVVCDDVVDLKTRGKERRRRRGAVCDADD